MTETPTFKFEQLKHPSKSAQSLKGRQRSSNALLNNSPYTDAESSNPLLIAYSLFEEFY
jgi:hypothetical protein